MAESNADDSNWTKTPAKHVMGATGQVIKYFLIEVEMKLIEVSLLISFLWKIGDRLLSAKRLDFLSSGMANSEGPSAVVGPLPPCEQSNKTQ